MAIAERSLTSASSTASAAQTLSVTPTGMQTDDWMLAWFSHLGGASTHAAPAGWTAINTITQGGVTVSSWRKKAGASEAGPYQFDTQAGGNRRISLHIRAFSGVDGTNPIDGTPTTNQSGSAGSLTHSASTSSGAGRFWCLFTAKGTAAAATTTLDTAAGFTETADNCSANGTLSNINGGLQYKSVGSGSTGTQQVTSPDATNQIWAGTGVLLAPSGGGNVVQADGTVATASTVTASATVISSAPAATTTMPSAAYGGGFQNVGCFAPSGVGHGWKAAAGGDVFGFHITQDGITWRPTNKTTGGPHHSATTRTLRPSAVIGSATVANRLWAFCGSDNNGGGNGNVLRGAYDPGTGFVDWIILCSTASGDGPAGGSSTHPRQSGRLLALDEANDTIYACGVDGIARIQNLGGGAGAGTVTNNRALTGETVTGLILDPANPQIGWATTGKAGTSTTPNPGAWRLTNLRSGTVTETREAISAPGPHDLVMVDTGTDRYVFVAAMTQGVRRWLVSANINTGWVDITNDFEAGGTNNGAAGIDAVAVTNQIHVLVSNSGPNNLTNSGSYTRLGLNAAPDWFNESPQWTVNMVPWAETETWWLSRLIPGLMLGGTGYDSCCPRIDPDNSNIAMFWGRSGMWRSQNAWQTWRPSVQGTVGVMGWIAEARPGGNDLTLVGDGDWSLERMTDPTGVTDAADPVRPRPGGGMGLMWTDDGSEVGWACGDPFSGANEAGVFVSTNGGVTWVDQGLPVGVDAHGVAIGYNTSGSRVLLTVKGTGIQRKVGTGAWSQVSTLTVPQDSQSHNQHFCWPRNSDLGAPSGRRAFVYCTGHNGLLRSDDHGATWSTIHAKTNTSESAGSIAYDPADIDTLYYTVDNGVGADTGLWKITNASGSPTATKIGPTMTSPGPCAVDPSSGVVYVATTNLDSGGAKLYASPSNNPGGATVFTDISDDLWEYGPWAPCDMTVTANGKIVVANRQGGYFVATQAGSVPVVLADAAVADALAIGADATVIAGTPGVLTASGTVATTSTISALATIIGGVAAPAIPRGFNGVWWPKLRVTVGVGGSLDPGASYLHLGVGPGLGTGMLSGTTFVDVNANGNRMRSISISTRGRENPLDAANPCAATITLTNASGDYDPDNPSSPLFGLDIGAPIDIRAEYPLDTIWRLFYGTITGIVLNPDDTDPTVTFACADGLETLGRAQLTTQDAPVGDGDRAGARVSRVATEAAYPTALRSVETGYSTMAPTVYGDSALELLRKVEATEFGLLFVDGAGVLTFYDRHHMATAARSTTVQVTFAGPAAPGQLAMPELTLDWSRDRTFNDVHVTRDPIPTAPNPDGRTEQPADEPVEQVATDPATSAPEVWGTLSLPAAVGQLSVDDPSAKALAEYLLDRFNISASRVRGVTVNALRDRGMWELLLGLQLADRVRVVRDYGPRVISEQLLIQGMSMDITASPPGWTFSFNTTLPPDAPTLFRLGTAQLGSTLTGRLGW